VIYGPDGRPVQSEQKIESAADAYNAMDATTGYAGYTGTLDPGLRGGWIEASGLSAQASPIDKIIGLKLNRQTERRASRAAYMVNPVLWGALEVISSFVIGEGVSYGEIADTKGMQAIEDFWFENDIDELIRRFFTEWMVDGENLTIFPEFEPDGTPEVALYDVDDYLNLKTKPGLPHKVQSAEVVLAGDTIENPTTLQSDQFTWMANDSLWNDPRGWPVIMRAIGPAFAYVGFVNTRMRVHDIQARINALYWAFANDQKELDAKAEKYKNLPKTGRVLTLHKLPTGEKEEFEFLETKANAVDSVADGRQIRLIFALAMNLPEHYLGEGGDVNRSTADAMGAPTKKAFKKKQQYVKRWLDMITRTMLIRKFGAKARYTVKKYRANDNGGIDVSSSRVPATRLEFPWLFPEINDEDAMGLVRRVQLAAQFRLASQETLSGMMGFDWAAELERLPRDLKLDPVNNNGNPNQPGQPGQSGVNQGMNNTLGNNSNPGSATGGPIGGGNNG